MNALSRAITVASLPQSCEVCRGEQRVLIASPNGRHAGLVPCLHCVWGLPIVRVVKDGAQ